MKKAISIQDNAEPLLGLASCLRTINNKLALQLAKQALVKNPKYVNYDYRKEQLWGENYKLQQKYFYKMITFKLMWSWQNQK